VSRPLRICLIASSRFPVREPFAGGLEAHTHVLASELVRRGHQVSLFAGEGSDPTLPVTVLPVETFECSDSARADVAAPPRQWMAEHHAYLGLMLELAGSGAERFDVIHNNTLHHLPVAMASSVPVPMVTTLHTPPIPWLESAACFAPSHSRFAAVSDCTSRAWSHAVVSTTILNGVDTDLWRQGEGGGGVVWTGRIVPEKAPHHAVAAARAAGVPIRLAGPALDQSYFEAEIEPRLGPDATYLGHLPQAELVDVVGAADVAVVTPEWDEPYGLVAAEAMACGTPVAAYARGALPELVDASTGRLAPPGDIAGLAGAILAARDLDRDVVRRTAQLRFGKHRMVAEYEQLYLELVAG
jgi:glycosyltransferase involved in cell wall biosynthesis